MSGGTLTFYRTWHWQDAVRDYTIEVDGAAIGVLAPRATLTHEVAAGSHLCRAAISSTGSADVEVVVPPGGQVRVHVKPGRGPALRRVNTVDQWLRLEVKP